MERTSAAVKFKKLYLYKGRRFVVPRSTITYRRKRASGSLQPNTGHASAGMLDDVGSERSVNVSSRRANTAGPSDRRHDVCDAQTGNVPTGRVCQQHVGEPDGQCHDAEDPDDPPLLNSQATSSQGGDEETQQSDADEISIEVDDQEALPAFEEAEFLAGCLKEFGNDTLPNSPTRKADAIAMIMSFAVGHGLTWSCVEDLLKLINSLFGSDALPRTKYLLRKLWSPKEGKFVKHYYYCEDCKSALQDEGTSVLKCTICGTCRDASLLRSSGTFFSILNFQEQLRFLISKNSDALYENLQKLECASTSESVTDITSARLYLKLRNEGVLAPTDVTFTFNTDGSPVWNSSKTSVWPIQFIINELPPSVRLQDCALAGLWFGKSHPNMSLFLTKFVEEVNSTSPVVWRHGNQVLSSRAFALCCCVDTPARALVQNHISFNGFFPCTWCLVCGTHFEGSMRFLSASPDQERTDALVRRDMALALEVGFTVNGVKGPSPLMNLSTFDLVRGQAVDYMHCVLLGVARQVTESMLRMCSPSGLARVNRRLEDVTPPHCFTRLPRSLNERAYWKASEWRHWLLFYSLPCTLGVLPVDAWRHFSRLVEATHILLLTELTPALLRRADGLLRLFLSRARDLYGDSSMTYNMHLLLHLTASVEYLGPLWAHSAFVFEGGNGTLLKTITAAKGAPLQVVERVAMHQQLETVISSASLSHTVKSLCQDMLGHRPIKSFSRVDGACMLGTATLIHSFSSAEEAALQGVCGYVPGSAMEFFRFVLNGQVYHSSSYTRAKRTDSSVIKSSAMCQFYRILRVIKFTVSGSEKCVLLCKEIVLSETPAANFPRHIREAAISPLATIDAIELHQVVCPSLFINFPNDQKSYVCELPNTIERD